MKNTQKVTRAAKNANTIFYSMVNNIGSKGIISSTIPAWRTGNIKKKHGTKNERRSKERLRK